MTGLEAIRRIPDPVARARVLRQYFLNKKIESTRDSILSCDNCSLHKNVRAPVPWSGPSPSPIAFLGEGPGAEEDTFGIPFVGKSGQLFDHLLTQAKLDRDEVFVTNVVCCRPPENRDPTPTEIAACSPNLDAQLELAGAWVGVTLGSYALAAVTNRTRSQVKITAERGLPISIKGRIWIPTFHPAYALRNPQAGKQILTDIRSAVALQQGEDELPTKYYLDAIRADEKGQDIITTLGEKGYAVLRLHRVGDVVLVVRDETVTPPDFLADKYVVYTLSELLRMGEVGKAQQFDDDDYERVHLVKKVLGATVLA